MKKYQNAFFYKRFFSEIIDFSLSLLISILIIWAIGIFSYKEKIPTNILIWTIFVGIFNISLFFLVLPLIWRGKTLGKFLLKIKIISSKNNKFNYFSILRRSLFAVLPLFIIWTLVFLVAYYNSHKIENANNVTQEIINKFFQIFNYAISIFKFIDYLFVVVYKKKLSIIDIFSKTRVVDKDEIIIDDIELVKLMPFYSKKRKIVYIENNNNLSNKEIEDDN
ncbi:RDD family protein [Mycoplasma sp. OR1901]|uniref:RDD family protein n=1 Tax=Mycoplasma sp. OR1901 TaxID=2742195 RepID=UPI0015829B45|nr:RDD family protein [Mycoplasma sp. OR1901]QKT05326.1 RDD family protein [Mycoplasma sp. OR1901]